ncbi:hypothetical protein BX661DRAFT_195592 [Kickxella alabastrina]|uniref:uncharacterized protein n=1 Tax=Kickxella alabastrina TaxID=61397 RepID=UPI00221F48F9|nr:uncharacterized protein BX661DRAFT_195592 [Kickxella alabastrina]KAI7835035.1 hypothetical protein BX661DRAFT_195592 [Kickxella alabastrina]
MHYHNTNSSRQNPLLSISALLDGPSLVPVAAFEAAVETGTLCEQPLMLEHRQNNICNLISSDTSDNMTTPSSRICSLTSPPTPVPTTDDCASAALHTTTASSSKEISCMNCRTTSTPLWRRDPASGSHLCNRCGLYLKTYNVMHPLTKIKRRAMNTVATKKDPLQAANPTVEEMDDVEQIPRPANCHPAQLQQVDVRAAQKRRITPKQLISLGMTPKCFNCCAEQTPLWRRDPEDNIICNSCGLFYKLHGKARPVSMKRAAVKRRNRTVAHHRQQGSSAAEAVGSPPVLSKPATVDVSEETRAPATVSSDAGAVADSSMGGLEFLMKAAELSPLAQADPSQTTKHAPCSGLDMLVSLASVAAAEFSFAENSTEVMAAEDPAMQQSGGVHKEKLQLECQRLEQLLAKSKAMLSTLN